MPEYSGNISPYDYSTSGGYSSADSGTNTSGSKDNSWITALIGGVFGNAAGIIGSINGNVPTTNVYQQGGNDTPGSGGNTLLWVGLGVVVVLVVVLLMRK